ncbi:hypothetical protein CASFOL_018852 [Castilleja foliolosa]|uniref:Uncharacterized protein n=1 Tax=Castilleja foliolosa TaxID=1961234 RepID=A0ABD3D2P6_9LAMI
MEKTLEKTPIKAPIVLKENKNEDQNNTKSNSPNICINSGKTGTPDRLKLPNKAFKHIERYTSPTDQMMSPVTRGILERSRKGSRLLPPSANLIKVQALQLESGPVSNC